MKNACNKVSALDGFNKINKQTSFKFNQNNHLSWDTFKNTNIRVLNVINFEGLLC